MLIRDAAYDSLPKETRAELHERFADWLDQHGQELIELDEVVGYHLGQAAQYRRDLGQPSMHLERAAGRRLAAAGSRAEARSDMHGAANLLRRALALLPDDDLLRPTAIINQLSALDDSGLHDEQLRLIEELEQHVEPTLQMHGRIAHLQLRLATDPERAVEEAQGVTDQALGVFLEAGDDLGAAHAYHLVAWTHWLQSRAVPTVDSLERVLVHAQRAGTPGLAARATVMATGPLTYGPFTPVEIRARLGPFAATDSALGRLLALNVESHLARLDGRFDDAFDLLDQGDSIANGLGLLVLQAIRIQARGEMEHGRGRLDEARRAFEAAITALTELGQTSFLSTSLVALAQIVYDGGEPDKAERLALEGEQLGAAEDVVNFAWGGGLRARITAERGSYAAGEQLAREALDFAYRTDFPVVHAHAHEALAHVLVTAARRDEARIEFERALDLFRRYGFTFEGERVKALLDREASP